MENQAISISDWILMIVFFILFIVSIYLIIRVLLNSKKAGKFKLGIKDLKYKNQVFILIGILLIIVINCVLFFKKPEMSTLLATTMLFMMFSSNLVLQYFGIGIFENGIMVGGTLHTWDKVKNFNFKGNLLILNIESKKNPKVLHEYSFYVNNDSRAEEQKFLNLKIKR
ncbi:DUF5673 domain-containing protein [Candidatus Clostridium radicumherbarum]|uniref:DUF5673 domain-containing protein n=1 Tax=Candidatus Clostridium radicumherbarum TaxID=3381662 RepID=A0ABW8TVV6_9CLOT